MDRDHLHCRLLALAVASPENGLNQVVADIVVKLRLFGVIQFLVGKIGRVMRIDVAVVDVQNLRAYSNAPR